MYKLKHKLFGWNNIQWQNSAASGIARVFMLPNGKVVYWQYREQGVLKEITDPNQVQWLTCSPSKFGFNQDDNQL